MHWGSLPLCAPPGLHPSSGARLGVCLWVPLSLFGLRQQVDHRLGRLWTTDVYFSQFWTLRSPRTRRRQAGCLVSALLQAADVAFLLCPRRVEGGRLLSEVSFIRAPPSGPDSPPEGLSS